MVSRRPLRLSSVRSCDSARCGPKLAEHYAEDDTCRQYEREEDRMFGISVHLSLKKIASPRDAQHPAHTACGMAPHSRTRSRHSHPSRPHRLGRLAERRPRAAVAPSAALPAQVTERRFVLERIAQAERQGRIHLQRCILRLVMVQLHISWFSRIRCPHGERITPLDRRMQRHDIGHGRGVPAPSGEPALTHSSCSMR